MTTGSNPSRKNVTRKKPAVKKKTTAKRKPVAKKKSSSTTKGKVSSSAYAVKKESKKPRKSTASSKKKSSTARKSRSPYQTSRKKKGSSGVRKKKSSFSRVTEVGERRALFLTMLFLGLTLFGLVSLLSASSVSSLNESGDVLYLFRRQLILAAVGGVIFIFMSRFDYRRLRQMVPLFLGVSFLLLVLVLIPGLGVVRNGARRWLQVGSVVVQPAEFAKFSLIIFVAHLLALRERRMDRPELTVKPVMVIVFAMSGLLFLQPKISTALILGFTSVVMLFVAGAKVRSLLPWFAAGGAGLLAVVLVSGHGMQRIESFFNPESNPAGAYQMEQSQIGIANGSFIGVGIGNSSSKHDIPEVETDSIFANVAEEIGLLGTTLLICVFLMIAWFGLQAALKAPDRFGMLLAVGISCWIISQTFLNILVVLGVLPTTGVTLPFFSAGGSSLIMVLAASGLLTNIVRRAKT